MSEKSLEVIAAALFGLAFGSFANVVAFRVPDRLSVVKPRSFCPACKAEIGAVDNIPVLSWIMLRGRCRSCGERIALTYPLAELATAALFAGFAIKFRGAPVEIIAFWGLGFALVAISVADLRRMIVPNRILFPAAAFVFAALGVQSAVWGSTTRLVHGLEGAAGGFAFLYVIHFVIPKGMGFGDVKLAALLGLVLGWVRLAAVPVGFFAGFLVAAIVGVLLIVLGKGSRKTRIPFAPYLAVGCLAGIFAGDHLARIWLGS